MLNKEQFVSCRMECRTLYICVCHALIFLFELALLHAQRLAVRVHL